LIFNGNIELDNYFETAQDTVLAFMVDYKILIRVKGIDIEKGEFIKFLERMSLIKRETNSEETTYGVEKIVCVGWTFLQSINYDSGKLNLTLNQCLAPNPFTRFIYRSYNYQYKSELEDIDSRHLGNVLPLEISFNLNDFKVHKESPTVVVHEPIKIYVKEEEGPKTIIQPIPIMEEAEPEQEDILEVLPPIKPIEFQPIPDSIKLYKSRLTRIEMARLMSAGFETFLDENGDAPTPNDSISDKLNLELEINDPRSNNITIQLMGICFNDTFKGRNGGLVPNSLTFSTQFFTFPHMATERAKLYLGELPPIYNQVPEREKFHQRGWSTSSKYSTAEPIELIEWPGILYRIGPDGRPVCNN
jgi:hypothetical protein